VSSIRANRGKTVLLKEITEDSVLVQHDSTMAVQKQHDSAGGNVSRWNEYVDTSTVQ
jgi:hypothetical protein